jgi:hypothetical protein
MLRIVHLLSEESRSGWLIEKTTVPFSWPNNSEAIKSRGMAAQFALTNALEERRERRCIARAASFYG